MNLFWFIVITVVIYSVLQYIGRVRKNAQQKKYEENRRKRSVDLPMDKSADREKFDAIYMPDSKSSVKKIQAKPRIDVKVPDKKNTDHTKTKQLDDDEIFQKLYLNPNLTLHDVMSHSDTHIETHSNPFGGGTFGGGGAGADYSSNNDTSDIGDCGGGDD